MALSLADFAAQTQTPMMKGLIQIVTNESQILNRLNFIPVDGFSYRYNQERTLGGIVFRNLNQNYTDPALVAKGAVDTGVVNPMTEDLAIFGGQVQTDRQLIDKNGDAVRASRIAAKLKRAALHFDRNFFTGDNAADQASFLGLAPRLVNKQLIIAGDGLPSTLSAMTDGPVTCGAVDRLLDSVYGPNSQKILCMTRTARRNLSARVRLDARGMGITEASGTQIARYSESEILVFDEDSDNIPTLSDTEVFNGNPNTTSIYCIKLGGKVDEDAVQGLVGSKMIEHVAVGLLGTFYVDIVEALMCPAVFHPRAAARLLGIDVTPIPDLDD